jgi:hypothetical protein
MLRAYGWISNYKYNPVTAMSLIGQAGQRPACPKLDNICISFVFIQDYQFGIIGFLTSLSKFLGVKRHNSDSVYHP